MSIVVDVAPQTGEPITDQQEVVTEVQNEETQQPEPKISDRYAGKSMEEVIKDYLEYRQSIDNLSDKERQELIGKLTN
mgnify:CR=1 FL=1